MSDLRWGRVRFRLGVSPPGGGRPLPFYTNINTCDCSIVAYMPATRYCNQASYCIAITSTESELELLPVTLP